MARVLQEKKLEILQGVLARLESTEAKVESAVFLKPKEREHLQDVGLLEPHTAEFAESGGKSNAELVRLSEGGIRIVFWDDEEGLEVYKIEMAALREQIKKLDRKQTVSSDDKRPEERKPQEQAQKWQRSVTHKDEDAVLLAVRVEPEIRDQFHALMRAKNTTAQEYLADIVTEQVRQNPDLVKKGEQMEAQGTKRHYRSKLQLLKEENARLRGLAAAKSSRSA